MEDKKYCYRYVDIHDHHGCVRVELRKNIVLTETDKSFVHVHDMPYMDIETMRKYFGDKHYATKRCFKGAARSSYHLTKEDAFKAFLYRKYYQLSRLRLTLEKVEMALNGAKEYGYAVPCEYMDRLVAAEREAPESFAASVEPGPVASEFTWGGY